MINEVLKLIIVVKLRLKTNLTFYQSADQTIQKNIIEDILGLRIQEKQTTE